MTMSAAETTEAILLRRSRFGETSMVLVWLSPTHGKLRTAARGAADAPATAEAAEATKH